MCMKKINKIFKDKRGITLMECVVAIAILSIATLTTYKILSSGTKMLWRANRQDADVSQITAQSAQYIGETTPVQTDSVIIKPKDGTVGTETSIKGQWVVMVGDNGETTTIFIPYENA